MSPLPDPTILVDRIEASVAELVLHDGVEARSRAGHFVVCDGSGDYRRRPSDFGMVDELAG